VRHALCLLKWLLQTNKPSQMQVEHFKVAVALSKLNAGL